MYHHKLYNTTEWTLQLFFVGSVYWKFHFHSYIDAFHQCFLLSQVIKVMLQKNSDIRKWKTFVKATRKEKFRKKLAFHRSSKSWKYPKKFISTRYLLLKKDKMEVRRSIQTVIFIRSMRMAVILTGRSVGSPTSVTNTYMAHERCFSVYLLLFCKIKNH